jgi:S-disulfanyl-L-cysteine oxidoreductase SoxD
MKRQHMILLLIILIGASLSLLLFARTPPSTDQVIINNTAVPPVPTANGQIVAQGSALYSQQCAGCRGANLEGVPDWRIPLRNGSFPAPPHDSSGHTWHHPDALLLSVIANGGDPASKTTMPAFKDKLAADEMSAILTFFKSRWGKDEREYQWWMTVTRSRP